MMRFTAELGRRIRTFNIVDVFTRECLASEECRPRKPRTCVHTSEEYDGLVYGT